MGITRTTKTGLQKVGIGDRNWGNPINENVEALEAFSALSGLVVRPTEYPSAGLNVRVSAGSYQMADGTVGSYAGVSSQAIPASVSRAVWLTDAGVLTLGASFPTSAHVRLATVTTGTSTVTSVVDERVQLGAMGTGVGGGGGGVTDHGALTGLADDGHTQYHTDARALTWLGTRSTSDLIEGANLYYTDVRADARIAGAVGVSVAAFSHGHAASAITSGVLDPARLATGTADATTFARGDGTWSIGPVGPQGEQGIQGIQGEAGPQGEPGTTDHGLLTGLVDDDHTQYHTNARALTWLGTRSTTDLLEGTNLYYTDGRVDARITAATGVSVAAFSHDHTDMVHTTGTETIGGDKTLTGITTISGSSSAQLTVQGLATRVMEFRRSSDSAVMGYVADGGQGSGAGLGLWSSVHGQFSTPAGYNLILNNTSVTGLHANVPCLKLIMHTSQSVPPIQVQTSATVVKWSVDKAGRIVSSTTAPAITAGAGAGTTPTVSVAGTDQAGVITVTTGTTPAASGIVATITFSVAFAVAPKAVLLTPAEANAAALSGTGLVFAASAGVSTSVFTIDVGSTALAASTTYKWSYLVL